MKKQLKLVEDFPTPVIVMVCKTWLRKPQKPPKDQHWPWFVVSLKRCSEDYFAWRNQKEHMSLKKRPAMAQSVKDALRGMF